MAAYCRVYASHHLQAGCQEPGSAPEPYARRSVIKYGLPLHFYQQSKQRLRDAQPQTMEGAQHPTGDEDRSLSCCCALVTTVLL